MIVTEIEIQVRGKHYDLDGITKHNFSIIRPTRISVILLLVAGGLLTIMGGANLVDLETGLPWLTIDANVLALWSGILIMLLGTLRIWSARERYAVSITLADGEKNLVVSRNKEYITQIVHALNDAFFARIHSVGGGSKREFSVSGR